MTCVANLIEAGLLELGDFFCCYLQQPIPVFPTIGENLVNHTQVLPIRDLRRRQRIFVGGEYRSSCWVGFGEHDGGVTGASGEE